MDVEVPAVISRYAGRCKGCNKPYAEGDDIYWTKEDGAWCWNCRENPKPGPEAYKLAADLGFVPSADVERVNWVAVTEEWSRRNKKPGVGTQSLLAL